MQKETRLLYAEVCILTLADFEDRLFTYLVPEEMENEISKGSVVTVPFGVHNRLETAVVCRLCDNTTVKNAKSLNGFFDREICVSNELFELCEHIKDICFCSLAAAFKTVLPPGTKLNRSVLYSANPEADFSEGLSEKERQLCDYILGKKSVSSVALKRRFSGFFNPETVLTGLEKKGYIVKSGKATKDISDRVEKFVFLNRETETKNLHLSQSAQKVVELLCENSPIAQKQLLDMANVSLSVLQTLKKNGVITVSEVKKERNPYKEEFFSSLERKDFSLSEEQQRAYTALCELLSDKEPRCGLLYGVTGSGKTNVCLSVIDKAIEQKKGVIVLVPEISLTAQTVLAFASRYGNRISVLHSGLSEGERRDAFLRIKNKKSDIVIGTRSAIFAPVDNLGLVVMDEEQESSFKSDMTPRYHARDIARFRCAKNNALLLLCSATPSVESMYKAKSGVYSLICMKNRYGKAVLPNVGICDMRAEPKYVSAKSGSDGCCETMPNILGKELEKEIAENLAKGEQTILLMNRRGYRSFSVCYKCGEVIKCPNCSVSLTFHKGRGRERLMCHYCGYTATPKSICPSCGSEHVGYMGSGTEMLEESLKELFPTARTLRMDADTVSGQMTHEKILSRFRNKEADILVGTQMVAKGHDFPSVSLVGVINADSSLFLDDYRANERTFSLLTQVIGRAGRADIPGRAMIQTYNPENETIKLSAKQDYDKFYEGEIQLRKAAVFPPFCTLLTIKFVCDTEKDARNMAQSFGEELDRLCKGDYNDVKIALYGPFEDTIFKMAGKFRMKYVVKCRNSKRTRQLFSLICTSVGTKHKNTGSISVDINPTTV